ncbi:MAG: AgmX/PglI C-terminal domain-containing protein [Deltaproteobacteria bacterium]|nr:AgmX/PglI C-terminal domain-containing protein [Deltaproteobacteria bacterium]MBW1871842.1 AgmX/PglI C-terminal domain-containing protein [Deltaproteobacteria bacterium]
MNQTSSGEYFFERELQTMEVPNGVDKSLEVKVMWGPIVLDAYQIKDDESFLIGDHPDATLGISTSALGQQLFPLVSPGGIRGHVVSLTNGMNLEIIKDGQPLALKIPTSKGSVYSHAIQIGERCRLSIGQLAFVIQYSGPARGVKSRAFTNTDLGLMKWFVIFLVAAIGLWTAIQMTPKVKSEFSDYIKNPHRYAIAAPLHRPDKKTTFEKIEKKIIESVKTGKLSKWKASAKNKNGSVPKNTPAEKDWRSKTQGSLLDLLKKRGGGTSGHGGHISGGVTVADLDQELEGVHRPGMGNTGGIGSLRDGSGGPGVGGNGLDIDSHGPFGNNIEFTRVTVPIQSIGAIKVERPKKPPTTVVGGLTKDVVGDYINRHWNRLRFCYSQELGRDPNLYGKITVNFTIGADGRVFEADILQTTMHDNNVEQCVLRAMRLIRFPKPKGGGEVIVTYPFMFRTVG